MEQSRKVDDQCGRSDPETEVYESRTVLEKDLYRIAARLAFVNEEQITKDAVNDEGNREQHSIRSYTRDSLVSTSVKCVCNECRTGAYCHDRVEECERVIGQTFSVVARLALEQHHLVPAF